MDGRGVSVYNHLVVELVVGAGGLGQVAVQLPLGAGGARVHADDARRASLNQAISGALKKRER